MLTIPTFKPGQRVVLHYHPTEYRCPKCQAQSGVNLKGIKYRSTYICTILGNAINPFICFYCHQPYEENLEGWYAVFIHDLPEHKYAIPYTLLEPLED